MSFKITANTLKKLEHILQESGYLVRYEKGQFNSGYCILESRKIIVINKFLDMEGRIQSLSDLIPSVHIEKEKLDADERKFIEQLGSKDNPQGALELE